MTPLLVTALLIGLAGGVHCMAMCGGIVAALNLPLAPTTLTSRRANFGHQLAYSAGRIASYTCAGAIAGAVGGLGLLYDDVLPARIALLVIANGLVIMLGLYLAGLGTGILALERVGSVVWRGVVRIGARIAPARTWPRALVVGLAWGWIPCGLVYGALATALVSGSAARGAMVMAAFGLGTLPNLLAAGIAAASLQRLVRTPRVRLLAGIGVVLLGVVGLARIPGLSDHLRRGLHSLH
jgi:sulfite exporter TauE/SafE